MQTIDERVESRLLPHRAAPSPALPAGVTPPWPRKLLIVTDGCAGSIAALAAGRELAARAAAAVELLTVFVPRIPAPPIERRKETVRCEGRDRGEVAQLLHTVRRQRRMCLEGRGFWPLRLDVGDPVRAILQHVAATQADLVILGLGDANPEYRRRAGDTPAALVAQAQTPVLAAAAGTALPAARAILLVDRDALHQPSLRATLATMSESSTLWIVVAGGSEQGNAMSLASDADLSRMTLAVRTEARAVSDGIEVRAVRAGGDSVAAALHLAGDVRADLIVTPVHGTPGPIRSLVSNTVPRLLSHTRTAVLAVPDAA